MAGQLLAVLFLLTVVLVFGAGLLLVTSFFGPKLQALNGRKQMPYECGVFGETPKTSRVSVRFYLTAILFILFDIEILFMYPWALVFVDYVRETGGLFLLMEMLTFVFILVWGLFFVWRGRALQWE